MAQVDEYPHKGVYGMVRLVTKRMVQSYLAALARRTGLFLAHAPANVEPVRGEIFLRGLWTQTRDFVRYATLELLTREIRRNEIPGAIAELGVFRGHFAAAMNALLPDRELYLFDTFQSFDEQDVVAEGRAGLPPVRPVDFELTSVDSVIRRMPVPEHAIPKPGWFPESAEGLEDASFCLVSLDADLFQPIRAGLEFFYPRLSPGGYLLIHDYNNDLYPGSRKALEAFAAETSVAVVPIPDEGGSVVIGRPKRDAADT